ncbi:MAG: hypothetical protein IJ147_01545 [Lachnospiraceae bacterium]|nr:hypothetical protein [Lachnospiraceae bacterium]
MAQAYHFINGYIKTDNCIKQTTHASKLICILMLLVVFASVNLLTEQVFLAAIDVKKSYDILSLGAVFATMGSSLISITSLACNYFFEEYVQTRNYLFTYWGNKNISTTWNFLEDKKILLKDPNKTIAYESFAPEVVFEFGIANLRIPIPSNKKEFKTWKLGKNYLQMLITQKLYFRHLFENYASLKETGIFVWECTRYLLKSALLYIISLSFSILGGMFFIAGLIAIFVHS